MPIFSLYFALLLLELIRNISVLVAAADERQLVRRALQLFRQRSTTLVAICSSSSTEYITGSE
jgi:hypothetical protein